VRLLPLLLLLLCWLLAPLLLVGAMLPLLLLLLPVCVLLRVVLLPMVLLLVAVAVSMSVAVLLLVGCLLFSCSSLQHQQATRQHDEIQCHATCTKAAHAVVLPLILLLQQ
jgi:hypothetical protein